jgi:hypothetical protein
MAGQPQEPSWQPIGQEQTRAAGWPQQPPAYTPPGGSSPDAFGFGQQPGYGQQPGQGYPPPAPSSWAGQEQYAQEQYGQAATGHAAKPSGEKGFLGSLFDFSFNSFVTPKIIKVLYVLFTIWTVLWALIILRFGFHYGVAAGIFVLLVVEPIFILLTLGVYRVILEAFMVVFRIYEETKKISERGNS